MTRHRILIVDDDEKLLRSFERVLRSRFDVSVAENATRALSMIGAEEPYAIIISDYRMPGMNGVDFLARVMEVAPDTVRILLTGHADVQVAIKAVNEGNIFRLLDKPCPPKVLAKALMDGLRFVDLVNAEHEIMERTVQSSVAVLGDLVSLVRPEVYGRISRITPYVRHISRELAPQHLWEAVTAAKLSMIGFVMLPEAVVQEDLAGERLTTERQAQFASHAAFAAKFVGKIPRMEEVARIIRYQEKRFDGGGYPRDELRGLMLPMGARILKAVIDFDRHVCAGLSFGAALNAMSENEDWYDPDVLGSLFSLLGEEATTRENRVYLQGLEPGMVLGEDLYAKKDGKKVKLLAEGSELTEMMIDYLMSFKKNGLKEPILVCEVQFCRL
ncbi:HD domain-containing phosphohydrolase [Pseudodesulfovibrio tunisiensis]|uniref:HD domain-containing phosphohydrolase n=1 Tax=Pseudodesulfovibrio tunisiensis TaxID=463192 RepID=UPI001FB507D3|nr:HD domain-containing phosphohydrolase [Pseudodesulfovibrio tunisiensis]